MIKNEYSKNPDFYKDYKEINPGLILGLIIISFGLYIINWLYLKNKEFELIDKFAPNSNRGAIILMIIPFIWFFIYVVFKNLFFLGKDYLFLDIIQIVGWGIIIFLILKYIFDFCLSFGRITKTSGINWFIFYFLGTIGIISIFFNFYYLTPFIFFIIIIIPSMQSELNSHFSRFEMKKKGNIFYS